MEEENPSKTDIFDNPFTRKTRHSGVTDEVWERRQQLIGVVKKIGLRNSMEGTKTWAIHYKTSERSIYRDFKWIKGNYKPTDIQEAKITLDVAKNQAINQSLDILSKSNNNEEKLRAVQVLITASRHYREEMEAWGEKEKIPDKVNITSKNISLEIIRHDGRTNKSEDGIEPEAGRGVGSAPGQDTH